MPTPRNRPQPATEKPVAPAPSRPVALAIGALLLVVLLAYANAFGLGIALDGNQLLADQRIRAATPENLKLIFTTDYWWPLAADRLYRPFTTLSFLVNYSVLGHATQPFGYHALNIFLHALNTCLVFFLARRLLASVWPAFFAAALWAVHPITVDSVANLAGRADLLAAAGALGAVLCYFRANLAGVFLCSTLAVYSKESGAVVIALLLLSDLVPGLAKRSGDEQPRRRALYYLAAAIPIATYLLLRLRIAGALPEPFQPFMDNPLRGAGFFAARWTAVKILALDFALLILPVNLTADRSFNQIPIAGPADPVAWIGLLVCLAILAFAILRRREQPLWFWAAGFFGLTLLPSSNLAVIIGAPMAERFLYLPSIAFAVAVVVLLHRYAQPHTARVVLAFAIVLFAARTLARNPDWNTNLSLASNDAQAAPQSARLRAMHGDFLYDQNKSVDAPLRELEAAWAILEPLADAQSDAQIPARLGFYYLVKGDQSGSRTAEARAWYEKARAVAERAARIARAIQSDVDAAQLRAGKPLAALRPYERVFFTLGDASRAVGRYAEALEAYRYGRVLAPLANEGYDGPANAWLVQNNRPAAAAIILEKALAQGAAPKNVALVSQFYAQVPGGDCAVATQSGIAVLNVTCPKLRADFCPALAGLSRTFTEARRPARAAAFDRMAAAEFNCPAQR